MAAVQKRLNQNKASEKSIVTVYVVVQAVLLLLIKACEIFSLGFLTNICMFF